MAKKGEAAKSPEEQAASEVSAASYGDALKDYDQFVKDQASSIWAYDELDFLLDPEEHLFVRSYVIDRNDIAAMRRLGYTGESSTLKARAKKFRQNTEVQSAIDFLTKRMMEKLDITAERVQRQIAAVAFFDPREVMTFDRFGVTVLNSRFWNSDQATAVQSIKMGQYGLEIKMYDRLRAAEMLAKQLGVQKEDNNVEDAFRIAADQVMDKLGTVLGRMLPGGKGVQQDMAAKDPLLLENKSEQDV